MSDTDSFIEEVTEKVRKDQLYGYLKKYGWIAGALVVLAVGGAAYLEWSKAKAAKLAQGRGDAITAALGKEDASSQVSALSALSTDAGTAAVVVEFQKAAVLANDGQTEAALAALNAISADETVLHIYREMAQLKALVLGGKDMDQAERMMSLQSLAVAGGAFRPLAMEQIAVAKLDAGDKAGAIEQLSMLLIETGITASLRQRAIQLLVSLGGEIPAQPQLLSGN